MYFSYHNFYYSVQKYTQYYQLLIIIIIIKEKLFIYNILSR